jgi:hypothetical protein
LVQCAAVALRASAVEHHLTLLLELGQLGVRVEGPTGTDRVRQQLDSRRRKQRLLKAAEVIQQTRRRFRRDLRVSEERAAGLFLQRGEARIVLKPALPVGAVGVLAEDGDAVLGSRSPDRQDEIRSGDRNVEHRHRCSPEIDKGFIEGCPVAGSTSLTFAGKGIVTRTSPFSIRFEKSFAVVAVHTEVVCVDWAEERIVRVLVVRQLL